MDRARRLARPAVPPVMRRSRWGRGTVALAVLLGVLGGGIAYDRAQGDPVVASVSVGIDPSPLVVDAATNRAFVYNRTDGTVSTLDTRSGAVRDTVPVGSQYAWMAVAQRAGRVFVSSGGNDSITMLDARSGRVLRVDAPIAEATVRQIAVDEASGHVFVGHRDINVVSLLDAHSGAILRRVPVCGGPFAVADSARTGHVFVKCNDGVVDMLDARSGRVLHHVALPLSAFGYVFVDDATNRVFVQDETTSGRLAVLDAHTGALSAVRHVVSIANPVADPRTGHVYLSLGGPGIPGSPGAASQVAMLDGRSGAVLRRVVVPANPTVLACDARSGHLLVASVGAVRANLQPAGDGTLSVLDAATGAILRRVPLGLAPADMAIDPTAGRVLVDNSARDMSGYASGFSKAISAIPSEDLLTRVTRQVLTAARDVVPRWVPLAIQAPPPPAPPTRGTITTLDLARL